MNDFAHAFSLSSQNPIPEKFLEPHNVEVVQRILVLLLSMPFGGSRAAVLDLRDFQTIVQGSLACDRGTRAETLDSTRDAEETCWVLDQFPWVDCLRWWCDEPRRGSSIPQWLDIGIPPASLFDRTRSAVQCIDLTQSGWKYCE